MTRLLLLSGVQNEVSACYYPLLSEVSQEASHFDIMYSAYLKLEYNRFRLLDSVLEEQIGRRNLSSDAAD